MATATRRVIGPAQHGKRMSFKTFIQSSFEEGWLYELARGIIDVTEVPGPSPHGQIVHRLTRLLILYMESHPGIIKYRCCGGECCSRPLRHAIGPAPGPGGAYLSAPAGSCPRSGRRCPDHVVEVVSKGGKSRDYAESREEYLRVERS